MTSDREMVNGVIERLNLGDGTIADIMADDNSDALSFVERYRHQIEANAREANKRHEDYLTATAYDCGWQAGIEEAADHADRWNTGIGESIRALKTDGG